MDREVCILICNDGSLFATALADYLKMCGYNNLHLRRVRPDDIKLCCEELSPDILIQCIMRVDKKLQDHIWDLKMSVPGIKILILSYLAAPRTLRKLVGYGAEVPIILPATLSSIHRRIARLHFYSHPEEAVRHLLTDHIIKNHIFSVDRGFSYLCTAAYLRLINPYDTQRMDRLYSKVGEYFNVPHHRADRILRHYVKKAALHIKKGIFADTADPSVQELITVAADSFAEEHGLYEEPQNNKL